MRSGRIVRRGSSGLGLAGIAALALAAGMCGCRPRDGGQLQSEGEPYYVLSPKSLNNPFWDEVKKGMLNAARELGVRAEFVAPVEADAAKQVAMIEGLLTRSVDGLAISPNDPESVIDVIARGRAKGIPVICFDSDSPNSKRQCYVGTFNKEAGRRAGELLVSLGPAGGTVLAVSGGAGALNLNERLAGFREAIEGSPWRLVDVRYCNDDMAQATQIIEQYLQAHPDLAAIFGVGMWSVIPGATILKERGLAGKVMIVGFDVLQEELELVRDGAVQGLVGQRPVDMGYHAVMALHRLRQQPEAPAKDIDTGTVVVTAENLAAYLADQGITLP